jgi:hypothetical protein
VDYSWKEFKNLPNNENLSLESLWIRYNDMIYEYGMYNTNSHASYNSSGKKKKDDTINLYVEDDYVENYFE